MTASLDERNPDPSLSQRERHQGAAEPGSHDGDVGLDVQGGSDRHDARRSFRLEPDTPYARLRDVMRAGNRRTHALLEVHRMQPIAARGEARCATGEALQVPEV